MNRLELVTRLQESFIGQCEVPHANVQIAHEQAQFRRLGTVRALQQHQIESPVGSLVVLGLDGGPGQLVHGFFEVLGLSCDASVRVAGLLEFAPLVAQAAHRQAGQILNFLVRVGLGLSAHHGVESDEPRGQIALFDPDGCVKIARPQIVRTAGGYGLEGGQGVVETVAEVGGFAAHVGHGRLQRCRRHVLQARQIVVDLVHVTRVQGNLNESLQGGLFLLGPGSVLDG